MKIYYLIKNNKHYNSKIIFNNNNIINGSNLKDFNKYYLFEDLNNFDYFKLLFFKYVFSLKYKLVKVEYFIAFYDKDNNLILPSDISLYKNMNIICTIINNNNVYDSLAHIYKNNYFNCIEIFKINEKKKFGIKIFQNIKQKQILKQFFDEKLFSFNNLNYQYNNPFDPLIINVEYNSFINKMNEKKFSPKFRLQKSYMKYPSFSLKTEMSSIENKWFFRNIYNNHFCFCKGNNCLNEKMSQKCKYKFYLYILDINKNVYPKTEYLFMDFLFDELSSDDVYPIFEEMINQQFPAHYITEKSDIYNKFCKNIQKCLIVLPVKKEKLPINSNFLEKYLTLFLKIKVVVSGRGTTFNTNLFYNIEYITYICIGHGVCYFKDYLYNKDRIYGINKNNKILLPPSEKIISMAKKYGWQDKDIIKINLPRWDKYNLITDSKEKKNINSNSIFIMFTWRHIKKNKEISSFYIRNIIYLITDNILNENLLNNNISLYLCFHRLIDKKYIKLFKKILIQHKYIQFINQNDISECLSKTSLVVSDFSSIIFDLMYRSKPFIIYIPDGNDPKIEEIYINEYYELIQLMKNGSIYFENKYFSINDTVNKINYYINNNFTLETKLKQFYDSFGFKRENSLNKLIYYLKNI